MANNNVQNVRFLRNGTLFTSRELAKEALTGFMLTAEMDGSVILARYTDSTANTTKTLMGLVYISGSSQSITIFDIDDAGTDAKAYVDSLVGTGVSSSNTVTTQLEALSGSTADTSATTSVEGAKRYADDLISGLDYTDTAATGSYVSKVDEANGVISVTREALPTVAAISNAGKPITAVSESLGTISATAGTINAEFVNYAGTTAHTATTVEAAIDYLYETIDNFEDFDDTPVEGQYVSEVSFIDGRPQISRVALPNTTTVADDNKIVSDVTQTNGKITATTKNLTAVKLDGYAEGTDADIAATDTLGEALGKLQAQINAMDLSAVGTEGSVITSVSEEDGKVSATATPVKDVKLTGYVKNTTKTGDIAATDDIEDALSKLENKAAAITITNQDGSINVTTGATGTDINVNIKSGDKVLAKDGNAGLYTDIKLSAVTPSSTAVKEEYSLIGTDGSVLGTNIKIYKDSHIVSITYITNPTDTHYQNLEYVYLDASGATKTEYVDISSLVLEAEFASGVTADASGVVHGVVDATSEKDSSNNSFLTVGADGFKVSGIKDEIDAKINALDATGGTQTIAANKHVAVEVAEVDGKITTVTVVEDNIADADDLTQEIADRQSGDAELSNRLGTGVTTTNTATAQLAALSGSSDDTSATTSVAGAKKYADAKLADVVGGLDATVTDSTSGNHVTITIEELDGKLVQSGLTIEENDIASASALDAEIAARKAVDGVNGDAYTADTNAHYISGASTLYGADQALDTALNAVEGKVDNVAANYISGVTVNGTAVTNVNNVAPIVISPATSATTATSTEAITVATDTNGNITLGLAGIDCGTY